MFTSYFDASGSERDAGLAVGAFVASERAWIEFEERWSTRLKEDNIGYFHTTEFNSSTKQFASGWKDNDQRRTAIIRDLVQIIQEHVSRKFGSVVINTSLAQVFTNREQSQWNICAYSLAARGCAASLREWANIEQIGYAPKMIFEHGDKGNGRLIDTLKRDGFSEPIFMPKSSRTSLDGQDLAVPLQAADLWAFELFDPMRKIERDGYLRKIKPTYRELDRVHGEPRICRVESLEQLRPRLSMNAVLGDS